MLAQLAGEHVFIIDQHASDERFHLERIEENPELSAQPMLRPQPLSLSSAEQLTLMEHRELFRHHGFEFVTGESLPNTANNGANEMKISLVRAPTFREHLLGADDVRELLHDISESPNRLLSTPPPRLQRLYASKACHSAIKIGTKLRLDEQQKVVSQLALVKEPWKCAHGRPTTRHLVALGQNESVDFVLVMSSRFGDEANQRPL